MVWQVKSIGERETRHKVDNIEYQWGSRLRPGKIAADTLNKLTIGLNSMNQKDLIQYRLY